MAHKRSLTGIQPSGTLHLGNYLGMMKPALQLQEEYECLYFIADLHSVTSSKEAKNRYESTLDLVAAWLTFGLDVDKHLLYRQSDVCEVTEYAWYLSCFTGMGLLEKCHAYKDKSSKNEDVNHGLFAYPVLMAADILMYDVDVVPVGKDQKQHVEVARDIAGSVNAVLGEDTIKLPQALVREEVMVVPGLDGRKMSKSYGNGIGVFDDEKTLRKRLMSLKTDSTALEEPKSLSNSLLGEYFELFATQEQYDDLEARLNAGGLGWGHAKQELFELVRDFFAEPRARYLELRGDVGGLQKCLANGAERAREINREPLARLRSRLGFSA